jgi:hypothetical protein
LLFALICLDVYVSLFSLLFVSPLPSLHIHEDVT